jgi:hypothetical protein
MRAYEAAKNAEPEAGTRQSHYPLVDGATWTYHHENPTKEPWDEDDMTVATQYMDRDAFILTDQEDAMGEQTASTLQVQGTGVYRVHKEVSIGDMVAVKTTYDPAFLRYDEAWTDAGMEMTLRDDWTEECIFSSTAEKCAAGATKPGFTTHKFKVLGMHEQVTVPAGTFDTVLIERFKVEDPETKHFWFAMGVGKVRELDLESQATEELSDCNIPQ